MMQILNKEIVGFLYIDNEGYICIANDQGSCRLLIDGEDKLPQKANMLVTTESQDIRWKSDDKLETWDVKMLDLLIHDFKSEGHDPAEKFSCENKSYSTIIISTAEGRK